MKTKDIKKGTRIKLSIGWEATMADNGNGYTRSVDVGAPSRRPGVVYAYDIVAAKNAKGRWEKVEHTEAQLGLKKTVAELDGL